MFFNQLHQKLFRLPYEPYGYNETERIIEIPWALSCVNANDQRVLDVGYTYAEDRYLKELTNLDIPEIHGVDYVLDENKYPKIIKKQADLRIMSCYPNDHFDLILAISIIEHIGHKNDIYFKEDGFKKDWEGDIKSWTNLVKVLKPKGRIMISVPYGKQVDYDWFVQYDKKRLDRLIKFPGLKLMQKDLFIYRNQGWYHSSENELINIEYKGNHAPAAAGLACVLLQKA